MRQRLPNHPARSLRGFGSAYRGGFGPPSNRIGHFRLCVPTPPGVFPEMDGKPNTIDPNAYELDVLYNRIQKALDKLVELHTLLEVLMDEQ